MGAGEGARSKEKGVGSGESGGGSRERGADPRKDLSATGSCLAAPGVGGCRREDGIPNTVPGHNPVQHRGSSGLGGWRARWREEQEQEARSLHSYYIS